jgi:hypothetical protein
MGRKSKHAKSRIVPVREPSMRPSREEQGVQQHQYAPTEIRRLRDAAMRGLRDPQWGTELGRLYLDRKISTAMYGSGRWWADMAAKYRAALCSPSPTPRTCQFEVSINGKPPDVSQQSVLHDRAIVQQFREAHAILLSAGTAADLRRNSRGVLRQEPLRT